MNFPISFQNYLFDIDIQFEIFVENLLCILIVYEVVLQVDYSQIWVIPQLLEDTIYVLTINVVLSEL